MRDFIFITDLHLTSHSNVRTGDIVQDHKKKLEFVVDYANKHDALLLMGGDIFDRPSVPDFVKSELAPILLKCKYKPYAISGNHDMLFASHSKDFKTSLNLWSTHDIVKLLETEDFGEFVLTSVLPLKTVGKPQLAIFHGFLNIEDGAYTVHMSDLQTTDPTLLCLGHDHLVYEPVQLGAVRVVRPGSFSRKERVDEQMRIPQLVHIRFNPESDKKWGIKVVPIKTARTPEEIFKTKKYTVSTKDSRDSYQAVIDAIKSVQGNEMTFSSALHTVADPEVEMFVLDILNQQNIKKQLK